MEALDTQSNRDLIQGDLGKFRDRTNRNFRKFNKKHRVLHLGQSNSTFINIVQVGNRLAHC